MNTPFWFKYWLAGCLFLSLVALGLAVRAEPAEDPQVVAQNVYTQIKTNLNVAAVNALVTQYFDTRSMAIQALGLPYRSFSADQKTVYAQAFDTYFKKSLYDVLTTHKDVSISNLVSRVEGNRATVKCVVKSTNAQPIDLALNLSLAEDTWKANDVVMDNISLIVSYRPQFASLYKQGGFDGLVEYLNSH
ncbi:MAG: toluene tolerance family protein [Nevskia sp.]|nr:toluene tolerance family protein [Nevskia sp.]